MTVKSCVENKEAYTVELIIEVGAEEFDAAVERAYKKNRAGISIPGFRKGKATRKVIESMYGIGVFYEDAIQEVYPIACEKAVVEKELDIVAAPDIEIMDAGKAGLTFKADFTVRPEVEIDTYKGLEATKVLPTVTDEAMNAELNTLVERATRLEPVERAAADGDTANIDFEGFTDGLPFNGGKGDAFDLVLGSHSFIPGFEEQIVGMNVGDTREVSVTFPETYHAEDLAGKPAMFRVKLNEVKEKVVPTLDDEFAKDVSEFDTLDALKEDLRAKIADRMMQQSEGMFKQALLDQLGEKVTIELPKAMVEAQVDRIMSDYEARLQQQGITMEMYMSYMKLSMDSMREEVRPGAEKQIRTQLALDAIVRSENIAISNEEVKGEFAKIAEQMQVDVSEIEAVMSAEVFKRDVARDHAIRLVVENATAKMISAEEAAAAMKVEEVTAEEAKEEAKEEAPKKRTTRKKAAPKAEKTEDGAEPAPKKRSTRKKAAEKTEEEA